MNYHVKQKFKGLYVEKESWHGTGSKNYWQRSPTPLYFSRLRIRPDIDPGIGYSFPASFPSVFERDTGESGSISGRIGAYPYWIRDDVKPWIRDDVKLAYAARYKDSLISELRAFWHQFKPYARYYFNYDQYERDYNDPEKLQIGHWYYHCIPGYTLIKHWRGPCFDDLEIWREIIQWVYTKIAPIVDRQAEIIARRDWLWNNCHKIETRTQWLGWYEPVPVMEWEYLAEVKALARDFGKEFMVGDNYKYRARQGPPPYGTDEVEKRIANQIKSVPKFTARARIASGEYTISTEKPSGYSNEQELQRRIDAIHEQNRKLGYVRLRSEVEPELIQRQKALQPGLATPQKPQQQSPRRVARQVPVKGNCPNCGASNSPSSMFCNQCGQPL
jgi:zinc-ribbon domain